jgi:hypothetical protein
MCRCRKKATGGSSFCGFAGTRLTAADLEPDADGVAGTPKRKKRRTFKKILHLNLSYIQRIFILICQSILYEKV